MFAWFVIAAAVICLTGGSHAIHRLLVVILWTLAWTLAVIGIVLLAVAPLAVWPAIYVTRAAMCLLPLTVALWRTARARRRAPPGHLQRPSAPPRRLLERQ